MQISGLQSTLMLASEAERFILDLPQLGSVLEIRKSSPTSSQTLETGCSGFCPVTASIF